MGNIFDKLISKRLRSFLNKYDVLAEFHNGFQNKSTGDVILELTEQKVEKLGVIVRFACEISCSGGEVVKLLRSFIIGH